MIRLIFFDLQSESIEDYKDTLAAPDNSPYDIMFCADDVKNILEENYIDIIVSPANSHGFMDGGIDDVYRELFPGIQSRVQKCIETYQIKTPLGAFVLPIGSAMLVPTLENNTKLLACVPTMMLPEKIIGTYNVYWAMRGLFKVLDKIMAHPLHPNIMNVAIPCMGTGVGQLPPEVSARQIQAAMDDHVRKNISICDPKIPEPPKIISGEKDWAYVLSGHACPVAVYQE